MLTNDDLDLVIEGLINKREVLMIERDSITDKFLYFLRPSMSKRVDQLNTEIVIIDRDISVLIRKLM